MLTDFPVKWAATEVQQTIALLSEAVYREADIVAVVQASGLPIGQVALEPSSDLTWRSVFQVAAGQGRVLELLDVVAGRQPGLKVRLDELRADDPVLATEPVVPPDELDPASPTWKNFSSDGQAEAIIVANQPTFVDIAFLARGIEKSRSVCRLVTRFTSGKGGGTGFRVGRQHVLTNHHVLHDEKNGNERAESVELWFNYEDDVNGQPKNIVQVRCDVGTIIGEKADDWALVRATDPIPDEFPVLSLMESRVPAVNDRVYIIQHPRGGPKQIAFQHNLVRDVLDRTLQYWTDTDNGSSGSPVFDEKWAVVGLHHFTVEVPTDKMGLRNQGRRIDVIAERIRESRELPELQP